MSWSVSLPEPGGVEQIDALEAQPVSGSENVSEEISRQLAAAKEAAKAIVESGAVGTEPYNVSLSGHANPGHEPAEGYANDLVSVSISQATPPDDPETAEPDAS